MTARVPLCCAMYTPAAQQYIKQIAVVLERVPPPMLLLFKTNDCLRHAERRLGAGVNSFVITMRYCLQAILDDVHAGASTQGSVNATVKSRGARAQRIADGRRGHSWAARTRASLQRLRLRLTVWLLRAVASSSLFEMVVPWMRSMLRVC